MFPARAGMNQDVQGVRVEDGYVPRTRGDELLVV